MRLVVELYGAGVGVAEIGRRLGLAHYNHVYTYLRRAGVGPCRARRRKGELEKLAGQIIAAYHGGATIKQVAERFQSSVQAVSNLLNRHGAKLSPEESEARRIRAVSAANARRKAA
jgi:hypothetical protein